MELMYHPRVPSSGFINSHPLHSLPFSSAFFFAITHAEIVSFIFFFFFVSWLWTAMTNSITQRKSCPKTLVCPKRPTLVYSHFHLSPNIFFPTKCPSPFPSLPIPSLAFSPSPSTECPLPDCKHPWWINNCLAVKTKPWKHLCMCICMCIRYLG